MDHRSDTDRRRPRATRWAVLWLSAFVLAACGGPTPTTLSLVPDAAMIEVIRGDSAELRVTVSRSGSAAVDLTVAGAPAGVTAVFDPPTLAAGVNQAMLVITVSPAADDGVSELTLSAVSGSLAASAEVDLEVGSLTVSGRVLGLLDVGLPDVVVLSQGQDAVTTADGAFELSGLSTPYDVVLAFDDGGDGIVHAYRGLSSATPILTPFFGLMVGPSALPNEATLSGEVLGGAILPADHSAIICAEGLDQVVYGCVVVPELDSGYMLDMAWSGPAQVSVRIHAFHLERDAGDEVVAYHGYVTQDIDLGDGDVEVLDLDIESSVATDVFEAEVVHEDGSLLSAGYLLLNVAPGLSIPLTTVAGPAVEALVPTGSGFSYTLLLESGAGLVSRAGLGLDGGEVVIPLPPVQLAPADGAMNVGSGTSFRAFVPDGHSITYLWFPDTLGPMVALTSLDDDPVNLPGLTGTSFAYPPGVSYDWQLLGATLPEAGADRVPSVVDFYNVVLMVISGNGGPGPEADSNVLISASPNWSFDLAP